VPSASSTARLAPQQQPSHGPARPHTSTGHASAAGAIGGPVAVTPSARPPTEPPALATHKRPPDELPNERE
jgi:hypothetical protein